MASNKRRKLNGLEETKNISAFAARKHLKVHAVSQDQASSIQHEEKQDKSQDDINFHSITLLDNGASTIFRPPIDTSGNNAPDNEVNLSDSPSYENDATEQEIVDSNLTGDLIIDQTTLPNIPLQAFSTVNPNGISYNDSGAVIKIGSGERLIILGNYGLSVTQGQVSVLGAVLSPSAAIYHIYALSSHSLPVISSTNVDDAGSEVHIYGLGNNLDGLGSLSPLFFKLGHNDRIQDLKATEEQKHDRERSFQILFTTEGGPRRRLLQRIVLPPEWNEAVATISFKAYKSGRSKLVICGPKSSGKSTFAKLLINRLLTINSILDGKPSSTRIASGVMLLDLDPGQPEYSPPGQLSLLHISRPNFEPPYIHPQSSSPGISLIYANSIMAISPATDPTHYLACVSNLLSHYRHFVASNPNCPLVINTPGWVLGTGLEILTDLISRSQPTDIIYMSTEGPLGVVEALQNSAKSIPVVTLPSQLSENISRTAANLRAMQYMSYFHFSAGKDSSPHWNPNPLTSMPPWVVKYAGSDAGFLGILCLAEKPPPDMLKETINGNIVAVVVIDDLTAIGLQQNSREIEDVDEEFSYKGVASEQRKNLIIRTPEDYLPYFNPEITTVLEPSSSYTIGLALVRGIDTLNQNLQLLTPISPVIIQEVTDSGKSIILVSGKLDTPGWAYTEELYKREADEKATGFNQSAEVSDVEEEGTDEKGLGDYLRSPVRLPPQSTNPPWVKTLTGDQGRGTVGRVWRVRRDLGRTGTDGT